MSARFQSSPRTPPGPPVRSEGYPVQAAVLSRRFARTSASRTAIISALELLMPAADGRSLSNTRSMPRRISGKFRERRRNTVNGYVAQLTAGGGPCEVEHQACATTEVGQRHASVRARRRDDIEPALGRADQAAAAAIIGVLAKDFDAAGNEPGSPCVHVTALCPERRQHAPKPGGAGARDRGADSGFFERLCKIRRNHPVAEGLCPRTPRHALARRFAGALRSRGSLAVLARTTRRPSRSMRRSS